MNSSKSVQKLLLGFDNDAGASGSDVGEDQVLQQGRLSGTIPTDHRDGLALCNVDIQFLQGPMLAIELSSNSKRHLLEDAMVTAIVMSQTVRVTFTRDSCLGVMIRSTPRSSPSPLPRTGDPGRESVRNDEPTVVEYSPWLHATIPGGHFLFLGRRWELGFST